MKRMSALSVAIADAKASCIEPFLLAGFSSGGRTAQLKTCRDTSVVSNLGRGQTGWCRRRFHHPSRYTVGTNGTGSG